MFSVQLFSVGSFMTLWLCPHHHATCSCGVQLECDAPQFGSQYKLVQLCHSLKNSSRIKGQEERRKEGKKEYWGIGFSFYLRPYLAQSGFLVRLKLKSIWNRITLRVFQGKGRQQFFHDSRNICQCGISFASVLMCTPKRSKN